jgi:uncharacterized protein
MKWLILLTIKTYWITIPEKYRKTCLFKESCSHFVYRVTKQRGFLCGTAAFFQRRKKCRPGYEMMFSDTSIIRIKLVDGSFISKNELSDQLLNEVYALNNMLPH